MADALKAKRVAFLVTDGFEQVELTGPLDALKQQGAQTVIISPASGKVKGWQTKNWGDEFPVDLDLDNAKPTNFDALILPGGVMNPDKLRMNPKAVQFVKEFMTSQKPVAAICHGPWTLVEADVIQGRMLTSWPSLQTDIRNAGGNWVDQEVVVDGNLVTSRKPDDIPAFNEKTIALIAKTPVLAIIR